MVHLGMYNLKDLNTDKIAPEEYFMNAYIYEVYEQEQGRTFTNQFSEIMNSKYKK